MSDDTIFTICVLLIAVPVIGFMILCAISDGLESRRQQRFARYRRDIRKQYPPMDAQQEFESARKRHKGE